MRARRFSDPACTATTLLDSVDYFLADGKCHPSPSSLLYFNANCTSGVFNYYDDQNCATSPNTTAVRGDSKCVDSHRVSTKWFSSFDVGCVDGGALMGVPSKPLGPATSSTATTPSATASATSAAISTATAGPDNRGVVDPGSGTVLKIALGGNITL
ncbi:uncharacterized protein EV422DRAFT_332561 [Fimicolochytrium jonesii]|uniref:uncharacterized protein n=1 Tax=Fimicolochytrium jonesii TaxID=1396493 RepID=UPI0022FEEAE8|nr:uncharacterized protein EV422DRAFT_332561 [Fimicolochytrium jonesii]KAI8816073.1 hypothetical protein EV422DRAFT_332561 [Fimicolochytrium jonesii]